MSFDTHSNRSLSGASASASTPASSIRQRPATGAGAGAGNVSPVPSSSTSTIQQQGLSWTEATVRKQVASLDIELHEQDCVQPEAEHSAPSLFGLRRKIAAALPEMGRAPASASGSSRDSASWHTSVFQDLGVGVDGARLRKVERALEEVERDIEVQVLSRFRLAELEVDVFTEQRTGEWVVRAPAPPGSVVDAAPSWRGVYSAWDVDIDSRAIVARGKLRSFVELVDSRRVAVCPECARHVLCPACAGSKMVSLVYVVCITLRQSHFLPLQLPATHIHGPLQPTRSYLHPPHSLHRRAIDAIRSSALRVGLSHASQHDARLLFARATLTHRSCSSVAALHRTRATLRTFDLTDHPTRIRETPALTALLNSQDVVVRRTDGLFRLVVPGCLLPLPPPLPAPVHEPLRRVRTSKSVPWLSKFTRKKDSSPPQHPMFVP